MEHGKIEIKDLTTKKLSLELGAGETQMENLKAFDSLDIDSGTGKVTVSSSVINNLDLDMGIGEVKLDAKLMGKNDIDAGVGNLKINVQGEQEDYRIETDKGLGSIKIDGKEAISGQVLGNGKNYIRVNGGIGNIDIDFE